MKAVFLFAITILFSTLSIGVDKIKQDIRAGHYVGSGKIGDAAIEMNIFIQEGDASLHGHYLYRIYRNNIWFNGTLSQRNLVLKEDKVGGKEKEGSTGVFDGHWDEKNIFEGRWHAPKNPKKVLDFTIQFYEQGSKEAVTLENELNKKTMHVIEYKDLGIKFTCPSLLPGIPKKDSAGNTSEIFFKCPMIVSETTKAFEEAVGTEGFTKRLDPESEQPRRRKKAWKLDLGESGSDVGEFKKDNIRALYGTGCQKKYPDEGNYVLEFPSVIVITNGKKTFILNSDEENFEMEDLQKMTETFEFLK